jgi:hypothetical protein
MPQTSRNRKHAAAALSLYVLSATMFRPMRHCHVNSFRSGTPAGYARIYDKTKK